MSIRHEWLVLALIGVVVSLAAVPSISAVTTRVPTDPFSVLQQGRLIQRSELYVSALLGNTDAVIRDDGNLVKAYHQLLLRRSYLLSLTPQNAEQARWLNHLLTRNQASIARSQQTLGIASSRLNSILNRDLVALTTIDRISTNNPRLANQLADFELRAYQRYAQEVAQSGHLFGVPPATPVRIPGF